MSTPGAWGQIAVVVILLGGLLWLAVRKVDREDPYQYEMLEWGDEPAKASRAERSFPAILANDEDMHDSAA